MSDAFAPPRAPEMRRPVDVRGLRRRLRMSQRVFSATFHVALRDLRAWERGTAMPDAAAWTYLKVVDHDPDAVRSALARP